jgi:hypothetical protein
MTDMDTQSVYLFFCFCRDRVSLYSPGCPAWNSLCRPGWPQTQKSTCLCLPSARIKGMCHHQLARFSYNLIFFVEIPNNLLVSILHAMKNADRHYRNKYSM